MGYLFPQFSNSRIQSRPNVATISQCIFLLFAKSFSLSINTQKNLHSVTNCFMFCYQSEILICSFSPNPAGQSASDPILLFHSHRVDMFPLKLFSKLFLFIFLSSPRVGRPRGARAFHELRRYHTRPLQLNWGPKNVHFGKTHFWDLNINIRILKDLKNYQAQLFYVLSFPLGYLKTAQKTVQSSKNAGK